MGISDRSSLTDMYDPNTVTMENNAPWIPKTATISVADDVLVIPLTALYVSKETGADAEALTLADGMPGQILVVSLDTDGGGDGTLTPATATGWATVVFADVKDSVTFLYVDDTVGWIILGSKGTAGPPVTT
jgi:hypothetical protein